MKLDQVGDVGRELLDGCVVETLDVLQHTLQQDAPHMRVNVLHDSRFHHFAVTRWIVPIMGTMFTQSDNYDHTAFKVVDYLVLLSHEVDSHSLASETATATDTVQVALGLGRQVVVDHQRHLLPDTTAACSEFTSILQKKCSMMYHTCTPSQQPRT